MPEPLRRLISVTSQEEWTAYHQLRREVLFEPRGRSDYDPDLPDEKKPENHPLLLLLDREPIGTIRLDCGENGVGIVRMVAVRREWQRQGHGRAMVEMLEALACREGLRRLEVNSAADAAAFYERLGWRRTADRAAHPVLEKTLSPSRE
jgi:GNAT superfamily N-acetyltransferase